MNETIFHQLYLKLKISRKKAKFSTDMDFEYSFMEDSARKKPIGTKTLLISVAP